tara:strand:- start:725 stop:949 length:225 start_codon:yes stop_codon:yes gene_type:complete
MAADKAVRKAARKIKKATSINQVAEVLDALYDEKYEERDDDMEAAIAYVKDPTLQKEREHDLLKEVLQFLSTLD